MFRRGGTCPGGASYVTRSALPNDGPIYDFPARGGRRAPSPVRVATTHRPPSRGSAGRAGGRRPRGAARGPVGR
ncbi:hypothetical protein DVZ84_25725 [Streptomyces parvulus]|uniref:Uncharacterized protein n=1 Tax=Streptomyces parvulus TaxID=146923 RepID=A0A369UZI0_9ACTN|nr:hypothetical protein DVZ84_25725 [Streptomyces parvulus]